MNINSISSQYSNYNMSSSMQKTKSGTDRFDRAINAVQKQLEQKQKQLKELDKNKNLSAEALKLKKEEIQKQIEDLEKQLSELQVQKQQKAAEEAQSKESSSNSEKSDEERLTESLISNSVNLKSAQSDRLLKAKIERSATFEKITAENDGTVSQHKQENIAALDSAASSLQNSIDGKYGLVNKRVSEDIKNGAEEKTKTDDETAESAEENGDTLSNEASEAVIPHELVEHYKQNAFKAESKQDEQKVIDEAR